ncbi:caspase domain-containing protein [Armillaria novae-zelandiae]|uniref:Caspase domain-containing protein n=1 Tax=Armillaria novae-zelandiae TaxID=153914 RepID=A0AA39NSK6_9AGAR|nr:caspase domain-containing protein [Armillaria novae-zelandiae]
MPEPWVLIKALCLAFKNTFNGMIYTCPKNGLISVSDIPNEIRPSTAPREEIEGLRKEILSLEGLEERLANEYGITGDIDSVEVFDETKARAFSKMDEDTISALKDLDTLHRLRLRLSSFQLPHDFNFEESPSIHRIDTSRFWAVVIGIDAYESNPLHGCVRDALMMEQYLTEHLSLPKHRIQRLLGSNEHTSSDNYHIPTRVNIIQTLVGLMNNAEIQYGDNIIIYFAGHGSGYSTAGYCSNPMDSIEALCPIDRTEGNGSHVPDISDREINTIFQNICHVKGHHITFILDCSHAWITTGYPEQGIRTLPPLSNGSPKHMFSVADEYCRQLLCYESVYSDKWCPDMSSHVVIAACQEHQVITETRMETGIQGAFTKSLLGILKSGSFSERSTYIDLILALPTMHGQTPVIAGTHKNAQIWYQN